MNLVRVSAANEAPIAERGAYVVYWMIAARRAGWNFGLERAADHARRLGRPLVVVEPLRVDHPWASDRLHSFVVDGMARQRARLRRKARPLLPVCRAVAGSPGKGFLAALARRACLVVTDAFPTFFLPRMVAAAARALPVRLEVVDGNGVAPMAVPGKVFVLARSFRRWLQGNLAGLLADLPAVDPLRARLCEPDTLPGAIEKRWPRLGAELDLSALPIDHAVLPSPIRGGSRAGGAALASFVDDGLARYASERNQAASGTSSGLSPYLHFGHVSAHQILAAVAHAEGWSPARLSTRADGRREGFWGMSAGGESFLDQLITWRELGFNFCFHRDDAAKFSSLPDWAKGTLARHAGDRRPEIYSLAELEAARTGDPVWNAAQRQLIAEGRIHNYLRMLWGKKVLEWSPSPEIAWKRLIHLNDRWALDGRDPNSYSGIGWIFGRYDRPWGPEREIFGTIRYMSSASTLRKGARGYVGRWSD